MRWFFSFAVIGAVVLYLFLDRRNLKRFYFIFFRRTEHGLNKISSIAERFPRFWNYYGKAAVFAGLLSVVGSLVAISYGIFRMLTLKTADAGPKLVVPGAVSQNTLSKGMLIIPVEYWIASIAVLMVVHEFSHGIVAKAEGFELNSVGWGVAAVFPFAFVEPKGEQMLPGAEAEDSSGHWNQGSWKSRLKVLTAGSFANYLTAVLFFVAALSFSAAVTQASGISYMAQDDFPAAEAGLDNGTLYSVNNQTVESEKEMIEIAKSIKVGENVTLNTSEGVFTFEAMNKSGDAGGYIGVYFGSSRTIKPGLEQYSMVLNWFWNGLWTIANLNFLIGLFNMLPLKPLDGGWTIDTLVNQYLGEDYIKYVNKFSAAGWALLLAALFISFVGI